MSIYKHILFASDFSLDNLILGQKAKEIADKLGGQLSLIHVIERPVMYAHMLSSLEKIVADQIKHNKVIMEVFCEHVGVPTSRSFLVVGGTKSEINDLIKKQDIDLLILGAHGAGGYSHVLGSTATHMTHTAKCAVLTLDTQWITDGLRDKERIYYQRKLPFGKDYMAQGLAHGKPTKSLKETLPPKEQAPKHWGSKHGIYQETKRGSMPGLRPKGMPFGRMEDEDTEDQSPAEDK